MKSGLFFPNHFVRIALQALEEVIGPGAMTTIYSHSNLAHLAEELPPDDMNKQFDFSDFAALFETLQSIFGSRGGRGLALRAGRITFTRGLSIFGKDSITEPQPGTGPLGAHSVLIRLNRLSNFLNTVSDQRSTVAVTDTADTYLFTVQVCPNCMDRSSSEPVCAFFEGLLAEAAKTFSGGLEYKTRELQCMAGGAESCVFEIKLD